MFNFVTFAFVAISLIVGFVISYTTSSRLIIWGGVALAFLILCGIRGSFNSFLEMVFGKDYRDKDKASKEESKIVLLLSKGIALYTLFLASSFLSACSMVSWAFDCWRTLFLLIFKWIAFIAFGCVFVSAAIMLPIKIMNPESGSYLSEIIFTVICAAIYVVFRYISRKLEKIINEREK